MTHLDLGASSKSSDSPSSSPHSQSDGYSYSSYEEDTDASISQMNIPYSRYQKGMILVQPSHSFSIR